MKNIVKYLSNIIVASLLTVLLLHLTMLVDAATIHAQSRGGLFVMASLSFISIGMCFISLFGQGPLYCRVKKGGIISYKPDKATGVRREDMLGTVTYVPYWQLLPFIGNIITIDQKGCC